MCWEASATPEYATYTLSAIFDVPNPFQALAPQSALASWVITSGTSSGKKRLASSIRYAPSDPGIVRYSHSAPFNAEEAVLHCPYDPSFRADEETKGWKYMSIVLSVSDSGCVYRPPIPLAVRANSLFAIWGST
jgi:hypothetical protein